MSTETFKLPKGFEKVLLVLAGMNLQAWYAGFKVSGYRRKIFNQEFMDKNFGEIHQNELKEKIQPYGYPDTGNGLYSHKLSYGYLKLNLEIGTTSMYSKEYTLILSNRWVLPKPQFF